MNLNLKNYRRRFFLAGLALIGIGSAASAAPSDIVPRGAIAYDLLASLASRGRIPGRTLRDFMRGDRLYTRAEIARFIASATPTTAADAVAVSALRREFAPELRQAAGASPTGGVALAGTVKPRALTDPDAGSLVVRGAGVAPVGRDGYAALMAGTYREEFDSKRPGFPAIETAFVRIDGRALDTTIGVKPIRFGPFYYGGMLLNDAAAAFPHLQVEKSFTLPGSLGRRAGRLRFTQIAGTFTENAFQDVPADVTGSRRYLLSRRYETENESRWTLYYAEAFKSTRLPDPLFALILPFYVYQNDWTKTNKNRFFGFLASDAQPDTFWLNYIASLGATYQADRRRGTTVSGEFLLDDLKAPGALGQTGFETPRKLGIALGVHAPDLDGTGRYGARLELATIDRGTYTYATPPNAWSERGRPLGFPTGPNANVAFGRVEAKVTDRLDLAVDGVVRRRKSGSTPGLENDGFGLYASYAVTNASFVGLRVAHARLEGEPSRTRLELNAGIGF